VALLQGRADVIRALKLIFMSYLDTYNKDDLQELKELITVNPRYTNVINEKLKSLNLNICDDGECRVVVHNETHDHVIKFQKKDDSRRQNKTEAKTYNKFKKRPVSKILTPITEHTENFDTVVQQKADQSNVDRRDVLKISAMLIYDYGYYAYDINKKNIGMYKNDGVDILSILDYGEGITPIKNTEFKNKHEAFDSVIDTIHIKI
jgi:hypothetical protein